MMKLRTAIEQNIIRLQGLADFYNIEALSLWQEAKTLQGIAYARKIEQADAYKARRHVTLNEIASLTRILEETDD